MCCWMCTVLCFFLFFSFFDFCHLREKKREELNLVWEKNNGARTKRLTTMNCCVHAKNTHDNYYVFGACKTASSLPLECSISFPLVCDSRETFYADFLSGCEASWNIPSLFFFIFILVILDFWFDLFILLSRMLFYLSSSVYRIFFHQTMRSFCVDTSHDSSNRMQFMLMRFAFLFRKGRNKKDKTDGSGDGGGGAGTPTSGTVGIAGDECSSKLYLRHANMQRFVKNHHLRQIIPLPPEIDLNEWLASQCTSFHEVFFENFQKQSCRICFASFFRKNAHVSP